MSRSTDRLKRSRIGVAALVVSGGILISRLLGVVREAIFAAFLGADNITDQYVAAFRIPDYANYLLAGGFLTITFIPIFSKYLADDDEEGGWRAFSSIVRWLAIGITALIIAAWIATPWIIETIYPEFTPDQVSTTVRLTRIVMTAQFAFVVGAMFAAVQYAQGVFTIPTLAPIIYNVGIIAGGVIYAWVTGTANPEGFIWGAVAGAFIGNLAVQWWGARRVGMHFDFGGGWFSGAVKQYVLMAIPLMIGQSIVALDESFMSIFGDLVGDGTQTHLLYARRTMLVPVGIIAQAAAVAAYPFLSRLFAEGKIRAMQSTVDKAMRWVLVLSIGAAGLLAALALPVVRRSTSGTRSMWQTAPPRRRRSSSTPSRYRSGVLCRSSPVRSTHAGRCGPRSSSAPSPPPSPSRSISCSQTNSASAAWPSPACSHFSPTRAHLRCSGIEGRTGTPGCVRCWERPGGRYRRPSSEPLRPS